MGKIVQHRLKLLVTSWYLQENSDVVPWLLTTVCLAPLWLMASCSLSIHEMDLQLQHLKFTKGSNNWLLGSAAHGGGTSNTNAVAAHAAVAGGYLHFPVFFKSIMQVSPGKATSFALEMARKLCSAPKLERQKLS